MRYFEDFAVGDVLPLRRHQITRAEIIAFAAEFDAQPFHLDEAAARDTMLGGLSASGWHTAALMMRALYESILRDSASMGSPGVKSLQWLKPVRPDDILSGRSVVTSTRASESRPDRGFVGFRHEMENDRGEIVLRAENPIMFRRRETSP